MVNTGVGSGGAAAPGAWAADAGADGGSRIMAPRTSPIPGPPRARTEDGPARSRLRQMPPPAHGAFTPQAAFGVPPPKQRPGLTQPKAPLSAFSGAALAR